MADAVVSSLAKIQEVQKEAKKDIVFLISFFRLCQPFKIYMAPQFAYGLKAYRGSLASEVKMKGKKTSLHTATMDETSAEEFLMHSIRIYESKRNK